MTKLVPGKSYLIVWCKSCKLGLRVRPEPLFEGQSAEIKQAQKLKCRGCGHEAMYEPSEMRVAEMRAGPQKA